MALPSPPRFRGPLLDHGGEIEAAGTPQPLMPYNANRNYFLLQNLHHTEPLWVDFGQAAVPAQPSIRLNPGGTLIFEETFIPIDSVFVLSAEAGHPFTAKEG